MFLIEKIYNKHIKNYVSTWYFRNNLINVRQKGVIGGGSDVINEVIYFNRYKFYFNISKLSEDVILIVITNNDRKLECATLKIDITNHFAELTGIVGNKTCAEPMLPVFGKGNILMNCIINYLGKNPYGIDIKYIELSDTSKKNCNNDKDFSMYMSDFYTLIEGVPWYTRFGFKHISNIANLDIKRNREILLKLHVSDINIEEIINNSLNYFNERINRAKMELVEPDRQDIKNYKYLKVAKDVCIEMFQEKRDNLLRTCIKDIAENGDNDEGCKLIYCIHKELMKAIGLVSIPLKNFKNEYRLFLK
jgi:hypothetical protein